MAPWPATSEYGQAEVAPRGPVENGTDAETPSRLTRLTELLDAAGRREIQQTTLTVEVEHQSFDEWWAPYTLGVGPAGRYVAELEGAQQAELRELCRERLPRAPVALTARAWAARGLAQPPIP